jgi:hypothetical protein
MHYLFHPLNLTHSLASPSLPRPAVPIPYKQPNNWGKEVSSAVKAVCKLDRAWLSPQDYAGYAAYASAAARSLRRFTLCTHLSAPCFAH